MSGIELMDAPSAAKAIMMLLAGVGETCTTIKFRCLFLMQVKVGILHALRSRMIDKAVAEECWRSVTGGAR